MDRPEATCSFIRTKEDRMNKSFYTSISRSLFILLWLLVSSCQPATGLETEPQPEEPVQSVEEPSAPQEEPAEIQPDTFHDSI